MNNFQRKLILSWCIFSIGGAIGIIMEITADYYFGALAVVSMGGAIARMIRRDFDPAPYNVVSLMSRPYKLFFAIYYIILAPIVFYLRFSHEHLITDNFIPFFTVAIFPIILTMIISERRLYLDLGDNYT